MGKLRPWKDPKTGRCGGVLDSLTAWAGRFACIPLFNVSVAISLAARAGLPQ